MRRHEEESVVDRGNAAAGPPALRVRPSGRLPRAPGAVQGDERADLAVALARILGVSPYRLRQWRKRGVAPNSAHLFRLLTLAESMGLRDGILMCPDRDMPEGFDSNVLRR